MHVGRYLGGGLGAYLVLDGSGKPRAERVVRVYRASAPQAQDPYTAKTYPDLLPSDTQMEQALVDAGLPHY